MSKTNPNENAGKPSAPLPGSDKLKRDLQTLAKAMAEAYWRGRIDHVNAEGELTHETMCEMAAAAACQTWQDWDTCADELLCELL